MSILAKFSFIAIGVILSSIVFFSFLAKRPPEEKAVEEPLIRKFPKTEKIDVSVSPAVQPESVGETGIIKLGVQATDSELDAFKKLPDADQENWVMFNLSPLIETDEARIVELLKRLKDGAGFDKLSTDLLRRRATHHSDNLIDWISSIFPAKNVEYQVMVAANVIAKDKQDEQRWDKLGKMLLQLQDREDHSFEWVQSAILTAMVREDPDQAIRWVNQHDAASADRLVEHLMSALIEIDKSKAEAFARSLSDPTLKRTAAAYLDRK